MGIPDLYWRQTLHICHELTLQSSDWMYSWGWKDGAYPDILLVANDKHVSRVSNIEAVMVKIADFRGDYGPS